MEISLEEIQKKFESLPEGLKWAVMAANVDDNIIEIGKTEGLNVEQMGQLSLETHMVMFGFTPSEKFEESIKNSLQLPSEKIHSIAGAVNEKILKKIREKMIESSMAEEDANDTQVLKSAGIEIVERGETLPVPEKLELNSAEKPEETHPILAQRLSGFTQSGLVETHHSLDNITKTNTPSQADIKPKIPSIDPYREIPE